MIPLLHLASNLSTYFLAVLATNLCAEQVIGTSIEAAGDAGEGVRVNPIQLDSVLIFPGKCWQTFDERSELSCIQANQSLPCRLQKLATWEQT